MLKSRDLMTREVFTLPATLSLPEAAWALMHHGLSAAPVRDGKGRLVGVLSEADLIDETRDGGLGDEATVADVMTPALLAVAEDDPAMNAAHLMVDHRIHHVVVLAAGGELVGMLTPMHFMKRLADDLHLDDDDLDVLGGDDDQSPTPTHH
jgi:CBS domain-containing protein